MTVHGFTGLELERASLFFKTIYSIKIDSARNVQMYGEKHLMTFTQNISQN